MPRKRLTFAAFRASGRDVADLRTVLPDQYDERRPGRVYAGKLVIEGKTRGRWTLTISNWSGSSTKLPGLERKLYDYGLDEGHIIGP